jgi:hypothetical protein
MLTNRHDCLQSEALERWERANSGRVAAQACNDLLSPAQAAVLRLAIDAMPEAAIGLAEQAFEAYGWPSDSVDPNCLDETGRVIWGVYRAYRGEA